LEAERDAPPSISEIERRDFKHFDLVEFSALASVRAVRVQPEGVNVGHMIVSADYSFGGGPINGHNTNTFGPDQGGGELTADGCLFILDDASADFGNDLTFSRAYVGASAHIGLRGVTTLAHPLDIGEASTVNIGDGAVLRGASNNTTPLDIVTGAAVVVTFDRSAGNDYIYAGAISGGARLVKTGGGTLTLTGASTYAGTTRVEQGALRYESDSNIGGGLNTLNTLDGGTLILTGGLPYAKQWALGGKGGTIETASAAEVSGQLSGSGAFTKTGEGSLVLSGANTYTGATTVRAGVLQITGTLGAGASEDGSALYAGDLLVPAGTLVFNQTTGTAQTLTGRLDGAGRFVKNGGGSLLLAGANALHRAGVFEVLGGSATIEGALTANEVVNAGTLAARQITGDVTNERGGHILVRSGVGGDSVINGVLRNDGVVTFENHGIAYRINSLENATASGVGLIEMTANFADPSSSDRIVLASGGIVSGRHIISVTNIEGAAFASGDIEIDLIQNAVFAQDAAVVLSSPVFAGIYRFDITSIGGAATGASATLRAVSYSPQGQALVCEAGSISTGWFTQLDNLTKRMGDLRLGLLAEIAPTDAPSLAASTNDALGYVAPPDAWRNLAAAPSAFWLRGYGLQAETDLGVAGIADFRENQYGADVGIDRAFGLNDQAALWVGAFVGYLNSKRNLHDAFGGKGKAESLSGGLYATYLRKDGWYIDATFKGQTFSNEFTAGGTKGEFDDYAIGVSIEIGKRFSFESGWFVEPSLQAAYTHLVAEDYTTREGLDVGVADSDIARFGASVRGGKVFSVGEYGYLQPSIKVGLRAQTSTGGRIDVSDATFRPDTDGVSATAGFGVSWQLTPRQQLSLEYEGSWGGKVEIPWSLNASYRLRF
jgi:outer membrane autotransporter protein